MIAAMRGLWKRAAALLLRRTEPRDAQGPGEAGAPRSTAPRTAAVTRTAAPRLAPSRPQASAADEADDAELDALRGELVRELDRLASSRPPQ